MKPVTSLTFGLTLGSLMGAVCCDPPRRRVYSPPRNAAQRRGIARPR